MSTCMRVGLAQSSRVRLQGRPEDAPCWRACGRRRRGRQWRLAEQGMQAPFGALRAGQRRRLGSQSVSMRFREAQLGHLLEAVVRWWVWRVRCHLVCVVALLQLSGRGRRGGPVSRRCAEFRFTGEQRWVRLAQGVRACSELSGTSVGGRLWSNQRVLAASVAFSW